jgi:hypothetical protein
VTDPTPVAATDEPGAQAAAAHFRSTVEAIETQVGAAIVGQGLLRRRQGRRQRAAHGRCSVSFQGSIAAAQTTRF